MAYYKDINLSQRKDRNPNTNYMAPNNFEITIDKLTKPSIGYTIVQCSVPSFDIGRAETAFSTRNVPLHADKINYGDLNVTFLVDENLDNYIELHDWMLAQVIQNDEYDKDYKRRDIKIIINSSHNNKVRTVTLRGAFPTNISEISLDSQITDIGYATCQATFAFAYFSID